MNIWGHQEYIRGWLSQPFICELHRKAPWLEGYQPLLAMNAYHLGLYVNPHTTDILYWQMPCSSAYILLCFKLFKGLWCAVLFSTVMWNNESFEDCQHLKPITAMKCPYYVFRIRHIMCTGKTEFRHLTSSLEEKWTNNLVLWKVALD